MPIPTPPKKGDPVKAETIVQIIDELKRLNRINVGPGMGCRNTSTGLQFWLQNSDEVGLAIIKDAGPDNEEDWADERYWINRVAITNNDGDATSNLILTEYPPNSPYHEYVTATNLQELKDATHSLTAGTYVVYWRDDDLSSPSKPRWYFDVGGGGSVPAGIYQYQVYQMVSDNQPGWDWVRAHPIT